jgi:hypothetical protein
MVTPTEMLEAEMDNLLANIAEDRKLIIGDLLSVRNSILESLRQVEQILNDFGVDPNEKTTNEEEW